MPVVLDPGLPSYPGSDIHAPLLSSAGKLNLRLAMSTLRKFYSYFDGRQPDRRRPLLGALFYRHGVVFVWLGCLLAAGSVMAESSNTVFLSISDLQGEVANRGRVISSFRLEGVVCAAEPGRRMIVLKDDTAAVLLEVPSQDDGFRPGQFVILEGNQCTLTRDDARLQAGTGPVVDNDGRHPPTTKAG